MLYNRKIILEDGTEYYGYGFGGRDSRVCEIVFNTSMVGYQEILSDPSYTNQGVVMSYPLIGNYGLTDEDYESKIISPSAFIVRDINDNPSNFRATKSLSELLEESDITGIYGVDTRRLIRSIRDIGSRRGAVTDINTPVEMGIALIKETPVPTDSVRHVSCKKRYYSRTSNPMYNVVAIDCGIKSNIIRMLNDNRCNVTIVPYDTSSDEIKALHPDGIFISNGPGNPEDVSEVVSTLKDLRGIPTFGICLGHQLIALSYGTRTYKLKFGHRGGNHPVKDIRSGRICITSQNHSYAVDDKSLMGNVLKVSHINLLDNTVEGLYSEQEKVFSVQYHPESAPGPSDARDLFHRFTELMKG